MGNRGADRFNELLTESKLSEAKGHKPTISALNSGTSPSDIVHSVASWLEEMSDDENDSIGRTIDNISDQLYNMAKDMRIKLPKKF